MTGLLLWLSAVAFTRSIAHPIITSNDWPTTAQTNDWLDTTNLNNWSPPKEAAFVPGSTSITGPYQVAATFKGGDEPLPGESLGDAVRQIMNLHFFFFNSWNRANQIVFPRDIGSQV